MTIVRSLRPARRLVSGVLVAVVTGVCVMSVTGTPAVASAERSRVRPGPRVATSASPAMSTSSYERNTLRRINAVRRLHHRKPLTFAACPSRVAHKWSAFLAGKHGFYHQSMVRLLRVCHARYAGETLGMGTMTPKKLVGLWMHSPPHRHILLSRSPRRIGIGATPGSNGEWVVTADFMRW